MSIQTSRRVAAPAAVVHDLLVDVDAWQLWSPHVVRVDPAGGRLEPGWTGRVKPFFGPATTMRVTSLVPDGGYTWSTGALGHRLDYSNRVTATGPATCTLEFAAEVHGPLSRLVERVVGSLSRFGQDRRMARLAMLAEGWRRA